MGKVTTTMHLYPADYEIVKTLAVERGITIPEAAMVIIGEHFRALRRIKSALEELKWR